MTMIVASKNSDGILIAADGRGDKVDAAGVVHESNHDVNKILSLTDDNIRVLTSCTRFGNIDRSVFHVRQSIRNRLPLTVESAARKLASRIENEMQSDLKQGSIVLIVAGYDVDEGDNPTQQRLWFIYSKDGHLIIEESPEPIAVSGGEGQIHDYIRSSHRNDRPHSDNLYSHIAAIRATELTDKGVGGKIRAHLIDGYIVKGIDISAIEQEIALKVAEAKT